MMRMQQRRKPEENIYNLIPPEFVEVQKPPTYVSKHPSNTAPTASTFGKSTASQLMTTNLAGELAPGKINHEHVKSGATFGPKKLHQADPNGYLKKTKAELPLPPKFYARGPMESTIPPYALPTINKKSAVNYVKQNALSAITQPVGNRPVPQTRFVDREGYGKKPAYLNKVKKEIQAEKDYVRAAMEQERQSYEMGQPHRRLLSEEDRLMLLENLKNKWEVVNKQYQAMTHMVILDTLGKVRRKEEYEAQLQSLEKSVEKLSKKFVFVEDAPQYY